jgi:hypothetical protein
MPPFGTQVAPFPACPSRRCQIVFYYMKCRLVIRPIVAKDRRQYRNQILTEDDLKLPGRRIGDITPKLSRAPTVPAGKPLAFRASAVVPCYSLLLLWRVWCRFGSLRRTFIVHRLYIAPYVFSRIGRFLWLWFSHKAHLSFGIKCYGECPLFGACEVCSP